MTMNPRNLFAHACFYGTIIFCKTVEARLSLLRIAQLHDDGVVPDNYKENLSVIAQSSGMQNLPQRKMNNLSKMAAEEWKYADQTEEAAEARRLSNLADEESALRELLGFGYASASMSYSFDSSLSFSMSYSFDSSFSFSMSFPYDESAQPTQAPFNFDDFPDLSDDFSFSFPEDNPSSPVVGTSAPSPSPVLSFSPTAVVGTPSTPTTTTSTVQVDPTANVDAGGKNSGPSTPDSTGGEEGDDNQSVGGLGDEEDGRINERSSDDNRVAQTTMIAVLVAAAATVGTALMVRHWYQRQGAAPAAMDPSAGSFLSSVQPSEMA